MVVVNSVFDCSLIELKKNSFPQGNLTPIENKINVPFEVKKFFTRMTYQDVCQEVRMRITSVINF